MVNINNVSAEGFKALFVEFPYLPFYVTDKAYFEGDIVYVEPNFYKALNTTTDAPPSENWEFYNDNVMNYVSDADIERAFAEAQINFNPNFFSENEAAEMVFYYLAAHYLVIDKNNALTPFGLGFVGYTQSKSVGSVSESYGIPQYMLNNPLLSGYAQTGYGRKYLSLIQPYLVGNIIFCPGRTTYG